MHNLIYSFANHHDNSSPRIPRQEEEEGEIIFNRIVTFTITDTIFSIIDMRC